MCIPHGERLTWEDENPGVKKNEIRVTIRITNEKMTKSIEKMTKRELKGWKKGRARNEG